MNETDPYSAMDGHLIERFYTAAAVGDDESVWGCLFCSGLHVAGT